MLHMTIEWTGIVLCVLGILQAVVCVRVDRYTARYFILFFSMLILYAAAKLAGQWLYGNTAARVVFVTAGFFDLCLPGVLAYIVSRYLLSVVDPQRQRRLLRGVMAGLLILHIMLVGGMQAAGLFSDVNLHNIYYRSSLYPLTYPTILLTILLDIYLLIRCRKALTRREKAAFWSYVTLPTAAMVVQMMAYELPIVFPALVFTAFTMYIFLLADRRERIHLQEQQNAKMKVDLLLSQIQPHFLYNSLLVIQQICLSDPEASAVAIGDFAKYLRHNMDSLTDDTPIPFSEELQHVKQYIRLQQLRFAEDLDVRYDILCTAFRMPTLTLQPLVENAIRYGIRQSDSGKGTVTVCARETENGFAVSVTDDGPGFAPDTVQTDGRGMSVGLQNVQKRLAMLCGGTLQVESAVGKGTTVTILLPKEVAIC